MNNKKMNGAVLAGAVASLFIAAHGFAEANTNTSANNDNQIAANGSKTVKCQLPDDKNACAGKDGCKGKDSCKGKDACKGKDGCKGKDSCKGKVVEDLSAEECKAQGGTVVK